MAICRRAKGEESRSVSLVKVLVMEALSLKLNMQSLIIMMHEIKNRLSLMGDTL